MYWIKTSFLLLYFLIPMIDLANISFRQNVCKIHWPFQTILRVNFLSSFFWILMILLITCHKFLELDDGALLHIKCRSAVIYSNRNNMWKESGGFQIELFSIIFSLFLFPPYVDFALLTESYFQNLSYGHSYFLISNPHTWWLMRWVTKLYI